MEKTEKELLTIILTIIILAFSVSYTKKPLLEKTLLALVGFIIVIGINTLAKKITAKHFDSEIEIKPWTIYRFGFRRDSHFKEPVPMSWTPLLLTLLTNATVWWLPITQFDAKEAPERVSKRYGRHRFSDITEWHIGLIAVWGLIANLIIAIIFYFLNTSYFLYFTKLNIYYAMWSLLPISNLDGTKILFSSRGLWLTLAIITGILTALAL